MKFWVIEKTVGGGNQIVFCRLRRSYSDVVGVLWTPKFKKATRFTRKKDAKRVADPDQRERVVRPKSQSFLFPGGGMA